MSMPKLIGYCGKLLDATEDYGRRWRAMEGNGKRWKAILNHQRVPPHSEIQNLQDNQQSGFSPKNLKIIL